MAKTSQTFSIDSGISTSAKVTVGGSTNANALAAILANTAFPAGNITVGQIAVSADTGTVSVKPAALPNGATVSFDISSSAASILLPVIKDARVRSSILIQVGREGLSMDCSSTVGVSSPDEIPLLVDMLKWPTCGGSRDGLMVDLAEFEGESPLTFSGFEGGAEKRISFQSSRIS